MDVKGAKWRRHAVGLLLAAAMAGGVSLPAMAQARASLSASSEAGFARLVLSFPARQSLPQYSVRLENGVLAVEFSEPITLPLPDLALMLPDTIAVARLDPDGRGLRFGLRGTVTVSQLEAGEKLFIDLLPPGWQGLAPGLPPDVVAELAARAQDASLMADQRRKAEMVRTLQPRAELRVGSNPTFMRVELNWNADAEAQFDLADGTARIDFDWPVPIDLYALQANLPEQIVSAENLVDADGSAVVLQLAEGVVPRFYRNSARQYVLDFDLDPAAGIARALEVEEAARLLGATSITAAQQETPSVIAEPAAEPPVVVPQVSAVGSTLRIAFPFDRDTASAVFRRGNTLWMLFETPSRIAEPEGAAAFASIASGFSVIPAADAVIVRIDLERDRLATLGSEGRAWVLSLGDALLTPTEPLSLKRRRTIEGEFEMVAALGHASRLHLFQDPEAGDTLSIVSAFPPAKGLVRGLDYVDFSALRSVHGLVLRPRSDGLQVAVEKDGAVISTQGGLHLSEAEGTRVLDRGEPAARRVGFVDLVSERQTDPAVLIQRRETLMARAAEAEGRQREEARMGLLRFFVANQLGHEGLGVARVLGEKLETQDLALPLRLYTAVAALLAHRPVEALAALQSPALSDQVDMLVWRTIARHQAGDAAGARADAIAAVSAVNDYPTWVRTQFLMAGSEAALDTNDVVTAQRFVAALEFGALDREQATRYQLISGRIAEAQGRADEALDVYGGVIAAEVPPTRVEAVYRTLALLDRLGRLDLPKAIETLSAETLMWRGDSIETEMEALLADLHFRSQKFREGFETVKAAAASSKGNGAVNALIERAQREFVALFRDGGAEALPDIEALALYYDFRDLTPPGGDGDEMIRKLAQRLVKVDLLAQAADLLQYQVDNRLKGAAQAQVAADLAVIQLANRNPEAALRVLNSTRLAELPPELERQRRILEARALIDADRADLAVDLLQRLDGRDAALLRADGFWRAGHYVQSAEVLERLYSDVAVPLSQPTRMNVVRAGVGYALGGDRIGLSRLRAKFSEAMVQSPEWPLFDYVTGTVSTSSVEFKQVARDLAAIDSLTAFLGAYRERYGADGAVAPERAIRATAA
jgi:hypothetical protein